MKFKIRNTQYKNCGCEGKRNVHRFSRYDCYRRFHLNFAGLTDNLNGKLLKNRRKTLKFITSGGYQFKGKTEFPGIDYIDIKIENGTVVTVLKDKINHIKWLTNKHL